MIRNMQLPIYSYTLLSFWKALHVKVFSLSLLIPFGIISFIRHFITVAVSSLLVGNTLIDFEN